MTLSWCGGDFNADGVTNANDLNQLALNWVQDESGEVAAATRPRAPRAPLANVAVLADDYYSSGPRALTESSRTPRTVEGSSAETFTVRDGQIGDNRGINHSQVPVGSPASSDLIGRPAGGVVDRLRARDRVDRSNQARWLWTELVDDLLGSDVDEWRRG